MAGGPSSLEDDDYDTEVGEDTVAAPPPQESVHPPLSADTAPVLPPTQPPSITPVEQPESTGGSAQQSAVSAPQSTLPAAGSEGQVHATLVSQEPRESQDFGFDSQTPPTDITPTSTPEPLKVNTQPVETEQTEIPGNMSLDELYAKVKKYFPGFKPNSILRFSSLLGPGKPSSMPKLWSEAKKPAKRKRGSEPVEFKLDCDFIPPDYMVNTDDEVTAH